MKRRSCAICLYDYHFEVFQLVVSLQIPRNVTFIGVTVFGCSSSHIYLEALEYPLEGKLQGGLPHAGAAGRF